MRFADDVDLLAETDGLQRSVDTLHRSSIDYGLQINVTKTKVMVFKGQSSNNLPDIRLGSRTLESVT